MKDKFFEDIDYSYEEAIARHVSFQTKSYIFLEKHQSDQCPYLDLRPTSLVRFRQCDGLAIEPNPLLPTRFDWQYSRNSLVAWFDAYSYERRSSSNSINCKWRFAKDAHTVPSLNLISINKFSD